MKIVVTTSLLSMLSVGCSDNLFPPNFKPVSECSYGNLKAYGEFDLPCDKVESNIKLAKQYIELNQVGDFDAISKNITVFYWRSNVLKARDGSTANGLSWQENGKGYISLNCVGRAMLHELFHHVDYKAKINRADGGHAGWDTNGYNELDTDYTFESLVISMPE